VKRPVDFIKQKIMNDGPIHAVVEVHMDFNSYKGGVYKMTAESELVGLHSVMIIGWGYDDENVMYWVGANTWGIRWGENGYFKIRT
jgi:cathepsin B